MGGFNLLWTLKLDLIEPLKRKQGLVLCQGQLLWFPLVCLTVLRFAICGFQFAEEFWVIPPGTIPDCGECGAWVFVSGFLERLLDCGVDFMYGVNFRVHS